MLEILLNIVKHHVKQTIQNECYVLDYVLTLYGVHFVSFVLQVARPLKAQSTKGYKMYLITVNHLIWVA